MSQPLDALKLANQVRAQRSQLKKDLKKNPSMIVGVLSDPPDYVHTMNVETLLKAIPYMGRRKIEDVLKAARMSGRTQVGDLTAQRREEVAFVIRRYLPKR